jgi:hypothetical protein
MGHPVNVGFGNTSIDVNAYAAAGIPGSNRFFYRFNGALSGGNRNGDYRTLAARL